MLSREASRSARSTLHFARRAYNVAARDGPGKVSTLEVRVHGGSRYADCDGQAHLLSRFALQDTTNGKSSLRLVRETDLLGGSLQTCVDREYITLRATFLRENLPYYVNAFADTLYKTAFKPHELQEKVIPAAQYDLAVFRQCKGRRAQELLYQATYRKGLGNPLYYDGVESVSVDSIKEYANRVFTRENIEIAAKDVNPVDLEKFVKESLVQSLPAGQNLVPKTAPKSYTGVECRERAAGGSAAVIAVPISDLKDVAQYQMLSDYLMSPLSDLSTIIAEARVDTYPDAALFLATVKGFDVEKVSQGVKKLVSELKKGVTLAPALEYSESKLALQNESNVLQRDIDFSKVKDFKLGKFNYAVVGDISRLPYKDEL